MKRIVKIYDVSSNKYIDLEVSEYLLNKITKSNDENIFSNIPDIDLKRRKI